MGTVHRIEGGIMYVRPAHQISFRYPRGSTTFLGQQKASRGGRRSWGWPLFLLFSGATVTMSVVVGKRALNKIMSSEASFREPTVYDLPQDLFIKVTNYRDVHAN